MKGVLPFRRLESSGRTCSGTKSREEVRGAGGADGFPGSPGERRVARVSLPFGGRQEALEVAHHPWGLPGTGRHLHTPLWGRDCRTQHCRATQREPTALRENRLGVSSCTSRGEPGARALTQAGVGAGESRLAARLCLERTGRCGFPVSQNASEGCFTECARDLCALGATALRKECPGAGDARAECQPRREISGTDKLSCEGSWTALGFPVM